MDLLNTYTLRVQTLSAYILEYLASEGIRDHLCRTFPWLTADMHQMYRRDIEAMVAGCRSAATFCKELSYRPEALASQSAVVDRLVCEITQFYTWIADALSQKNLDYVLPHVHVFAWDSRAACAAAELRWVCANADPLFAFQDMPAIRQFWATCFGGEFEVSVDILVDMLLHYATRTCLDEMRVRGNLLHLFGIFSKVVSVWQFARLVRLHGVPYTEPCDCEYSVELLVKAVYKVFSHTGFVGYGGDVVSQVVVQQSSYVGEPGQGYCVTRTSRSHPDKLVLCVFSPARRLVRNICFKPTYCCFRKARTAAHQLLGTTLPEPCILDMSHLLGTSPASIRSDMTRSEYDT